MTETDLITVEDSAAGAATQTASQADSPIANAEIPSSSTGASSRTAGAPAGADTASTESGDSANGSLAAMVLPELRALANRMGVKGTSGMRKGDLIAAIRDVQKSGSDGAPVNGTHSRGDSAQPAEAAQTAENQTAETQAAETQAAETQAGDKPTADRHGEGSQPRGEQGGGDQNSERRPPRERRAASRDAGAPAEGGKGNSDRQDNQKSVTRPDNQKSDNADGRESGDQGGEGGGGQQNRDDDGDGRQGRRGRRFRDRRRRGDRPGGEGGGGEAELREDDVVQPVAGILDVLDNYAFVRTSGYLAGPNDVYVSMNMVRKNGLRRGDAVTGAVRVAKEGDQSNQRQKFNPLVRLDTVNGGPVEDARKRPEFGKLTPLYPNQRLRLETTPDRLTTRIIDLIMPIGKGQRALIVSPPKAGKTTILQDIANAITRNNPECHLMVVLVDERPEEVTDMTRSVNGEVIASTFDRPPSDHTQAAELAIERAKRLVEQGKDVVVLLDSITRLGRAYNNASPASGRILSGGVDSTALYPPKRFLGAARNIENGGSLTIIATAMVETGSTGDTVIFEEFKGTGNAELKLDRKIAERRVFPAVDVNPSGTRKDELLLSADEFGIVHKLRRVLSGLDSHQAIDLLMSQLRKTKTNYEFLVQVSKTAPGSMDSD